MGASVHVCLAPAGADPRAAARTLLLSLAGTLVDNPTLTYGETGRPHVPGLAVSISYTARTVAVAASYDGPLGIDLEEVRPREVAPLANRWFTQEELRWMDQQADHLTAFLQLWTAKEAVGKARGLGLTNALLRHPMPLPPPAPHETEPAAATESSHMAGGASPNHLNPNATRHYPNADPDRLPADVARGPLHIHAVPGRLTRASLPDPPHGDAGADRLYGDVVPGDGRLAVLHLVVDEPSDARADGFTGWAAAGGQVVLAVAAGAGLSEVVVHRQGVVGSGTRFSVVVRGN